MLIKTEARNLIGGVSQQAPALRRPDQCEAAENCWFSPVDGVTKRPPTEHIADLGTATANSKYHTINRDGTEQYMVKVTSSGVSVWDAAGVTKTVNAPGGYSYLSSMASSDDVELTTVSDYTFVVNKQVTTAMDADTIDEDAAYTEAFIFVRQGSYKTEYAVRVRVSGTTYYSTVYTWDGSAALAGELSTIQTSAISSQLGVGLGTIPGITINYQGSVIRLAGASPTTIEFIAANDSVGDTVLSVAHREVPRVAGYLPEICYHGTVMKVIGDAEIDGDDYYVKFRVDDEDNEPFSTGLWVETAAEGEQYKVDASTMPHQLVRESDGTFTFGPITWDDRAVGDAASVPPPALIGAPVEDIFFYKDRLGMLGSGAVLLSETRQYFNVWRTTMLTLRDTAPIDVKLNHNRPAHLRWALPHNEDMILGSQFSQFVLRGSEILSPRTVSITPISEFENFVNLRPVSAGRSMFFAFPRGDQSGVRELFSGQNEDTFLGFDVSAQVPNYIEGAVDHMVLTTLEDTLVVKTDDHATRNTLWFYKWMWSGQEKVMSSWGKWTFGATDTVHHMAFIENRLYLLVERSSGLTLESIDLATGFTDTDSSYVTHLDRRFTEADVSVTYDAVNDEAYFAPPYSVNEADVFEVVDRQTGVRHQTRHSGGNVYVRGAAPTFFYCGVTYDMTYTFTVPIVKTQDGSGFVSEYDTKQSVLNGYIQYANSRAFQVEVTATNRDTYVYKMNGLKPGFSDQVVGAAPLQTGEFQYAVRGTAKDCTIVVRNPSPYPSNLLAASWEIRYRGRASRLQ